MNNQVQESNESNNSRSISGQRCPDLIVGTVQKNFVVVGNQGNGAAGPSKVHVSGVGDLSVQGLGAGQAVQVNYSCQAGNISATADALNQVIESDESNNDNSGGPFSCPHPQPAGTRTRAFRVDAFSATAVPAWRRD